MSDGKGPKRLNEKVRLRDPVDRFLLHELEGIMQQNRVRFGNQIDMAEATESYMRDYVKGTLGFLQPIRQGRGCPSSVQRHITIDIETQYWLDETAASCGVRGWKKLLNIALAKRMEMKGWQG